jgi:PEP-CTERM motif
VLFALPPAATIVTLGAGLPAQAGVIDNTSLADPPGVYFGSGNANTNFTVDTDNGIELGLSAITRYVGPIVPTGNVYEVPLGATAVATKTGADWGFDFSINLQPPGGSGLNLDEITALITLNDAVTGTTGSFNPLAIPDNVEQGSPAYAAQNSEALSFALIAGAFGDPLFNENINDTYTFTLSVREGDRLLGSDSIVVNAGTGAPVPEPTSMTLLGTGLAVLGVIRRRRKTRVSAPR